MTVDNDAVVITAVKLADDGSGDVVVRLYESPGGRARARARRRASRPRTVTATDLLERPLADGPRHESVDGSVRLSLRPFELVTLRLAR